MISSRDFVMRQIQQLVQALATLVGKRLEDPDVNFGQEAADAVASATGMPLDALRAASREEVIAACEREGAFNVDIAVPLADLLSADDDAASRIRAAWLYEEAMRVGAAVPFDVHERLERLRR